MPYVVANGAVSVRMARMVTTMVINITSVSALSIAASWEVAVDAASCGDSVDHWS